MIDPDVNVDRFSPMDVADPGPLVVVTVERVLLKGLEVPDPVCLD